MAKVDALMALCDELETHLTQQETTATHLATAAVQTLASRSWPPSEQLPLEQRKPYRRAFRAMQASLYVDQTRRFLNERDTVRAAYAAMQAGAFSGDLITDAERGSGTQQSARQGVKARARAITEYHKETDDLDSVLLPAVSSDNPMTYMHEGRQFIVVASTAPRTL